MGSKGVLASVSVSAWGCYLPVAGGPLPTLPAMPTWLHLLLQSLVSALWTSSLLSTTTMQRQATQMKEPSFGHNLKRALVWSQLLGFEFFTSWLLRDSGLAHITQLTQHCPVKRSGWPEMRTKYII